MVFSEGIGVDTTNRKYLTSKVNSLFLAKSDFKRISGGTNKKLPIKSDEESSLVAGVVLPGLRPSEYHFGVLYYQKPILAPLVSSFFISHRLQMQAFDASGNKKTRCLSHRVSGSSGGRTIQKG
jgi:hypothetical protein